MQKPGSKKGTGFSIDFVLEPLGLELARFSKRERLAFDGLNHFAAADALGASSRRCSATFRFLDMNRLQIHEKVSLGDTSRLTTVTP